MSLQNKKIELNASLNIKKNQRERDAMIIEYIKKARKQDFKSSISMFANKKLFNLDIFILGY